ncbi:DUF2795 domain-containing protein [Candidatus Mycolicibacterium alkanivorans]|uniref:DUF2795 domain-containing protein n=1 Tax=Candidatus Mycolicibacterium alkanivorans TaxID=2954114 RepID=A0ABS9YTU4_9MYCO|nr:DUF2795 domain-containing protein [Candidatus Mycolicibacterium alkanivorans]MCI4674630.1 DUF2795 domain-containing protein [Candidatus Mycolicibacterium alkanivorans]
MAGADRPADKQQPVDLAEKNGADQDVIDALGDLPDGQVSGPDQVQKAVF